MSEICKFTTGDLVRYVDVRTPAGSHCYLVIRAQRPIIGGPLRMECWDPMIRGYTYFWDYDLRLVSKWSDRITSQHTGMDHHP